MDPSQQKMMMFMPLMFGYMFYFPSSGLVLYWLTSNVVGIAQQWILNRGAPPPPEVVDVKPTPKRKEQELTVPERNIPSPKRDPASNSS